jgi:hypothetical protein
MKITKTPEEIVAMISNLANRPDLKEIQEQQVKAIYDLLNNAKKHEDSAVDVLSIGRPDKQTREPNIEVKTVSLVLINQNGVIDYNLNTNLAREFLIQALQQKKVPLTEIEGVTALDLSKIENFEIILNPEKNTTTLRFWLSTPKQKLADHAFEDFYDGRINRVVEEAYIAATRKAELMNWSDIELRGTDIEPQSANGGLSKLYFFEIWGIDNK